MKLTFLIAFCCFIVLFSQAQSALTFGQGNTPNVSVTASSQSSLAIRTLTEVGYLPNPAAASRFLLQATLGHNLGHIQEVTNVGIEKWLDAQFALPVVFRTQTYLAQLHQMMVDSLKAKNPANTYTLSSVYVGNVHFDASWFQGAMTAADVVRWRVAWALSELFVVSRVSAFDNNPYALSNYYDLLLENGLGNYRTLINKVTYHPAMGVYLTFMNNHATDSTNKVYPDENYARELMQLFSIGLYKLNMDGSEMRDANNQLIPTYNNNDIAGKSIYGLVLGRQPLLRRQREK